MTGPSAAKSERINLWVSEGQASRLRQAASLTQTTMTDFVLQSALERAGRVLSEQRWFVTDQTQSDELRRMLDEPLPSTAKFERLAARPSPFSSESR
jgi:uncharacterized protein (DUF1778 family)